MMSVVLEGDFLRDELDSGASGTALLGDPMIQRFVYLPMLQPDFLEAVFGTEEREGDLHFLADWAFASLEKRGEATGSATNADISPLLLGGLAFSLGLGFAFGLLSELFRHFFWANVYSNLDALNMEKIWPEL